MANNWKYSTLPASERISMIRGGNKDVYDDEIARSMSVIDSRNELGLDITDQKDWIDNISYNYNLSNAEKMGIPASKVNKTGYADSMLGTGTNKTNRKYVTVSNRKSDFEIQASSLLGEYYNKVNEAAKGIDHVREWLLNNGIDENSEDGQKYIKDFENELAAQTEKFKNEYASKVRSLAAQLL